MPTLKQILNAQAFVATSSATIRRDAMFAARREANAQRQALKTFEVSFKEGATFDVLATNATHAQEVAIETLELHSVPFAEITSIRRVDREPTRGQFIGMTTDEFAAYIRVSL